MTEQLKPCPCCGAEAKLQPQTHFTQSYSIHNGEKYVYVMCSECSLRADDVEEWNSRPSQWVPVSERVPETEEPVMVLSKMRYKRYKPNSQQAKAGIVGRWQEAGEYGGWTNCDAPIEWMPAPETKGE